MCAMHLEYYFWGLLIQSVRRKFMFAPAASAAFAARKLQGQSSFIADMDTTEFLPTPMFLAFVSLGIKWAPPLIKDFVHC